MTSIQRTRFDRIDLFRLLPPQRQRDYERRCVWRRFERRNQIIDRLSEARDVFIIESGAVRVFNYSLSGREVSYIDLAAGDFFGELAAIDGEPHSASVVALVETTLAIMPSGVFRALLSEHPPAGFVVMKRLVRALRLSTERIMELATLDSQDRIYAELLRIARSSTAGGKLVRITPRPTHLDIANRTGTSRETVARAFSALAREGIIERDGNALIVLDMARLEMKGQKPL